MYKTVLVVDDAVYSRTILIDILQQMGEYIILESESGKEAINTYYDYMKKGKTIDLVLLDTDMKRIDGLKTLGYLKELDPSCQVVMCGTQLKEEVLKGALTLGVTNFLVKPYAGEKVKGILSEWL